MKLTVFSDSHGDIESLINIVEKEKDSDVFIHLGDGEEAGQLKYTYPGKAFVTVRGNNDFGSTESYSNRLNYEGHLVFITHGHLFGVKQGLNRIAMEAKKMGADFVLYGHTHTARQDEIAGVVLFNPGSTNRYFSSPSYGIVEIEKTRITTAIIQKR